MFTYYIHIDPFDYTVQLQDSDAKIVFEKQTILFRKRIDGTFSLNRSGNEPLFDKLKALTFCETGTLSVSDNSGMIIQGTFIKKDLSISEAKCLISIKFDKLDEYSCLDGIQDKEFNILANYDGKPAMGIYSAKLLYRETIEYVSGTGTAEIPITRTSGYWKSTGVIGENNLLYPYPSPTYFPPGIADQASWTFYSNTYTWVSVGVAPDTNIFDITTVWVREVKTIIRQGEAQTSIPPNVGTSCDFYAWQFANTKTIDGIIYDKFGRNLEDSGVEENLSLDGDTFTLTNSFLCEGTTYIFSRCRKLNDIITTMIYDCFPSGFQSEFFKSTVNPISGKDLSNIMLSQKSDCIFTKPDGGSEYVESTDPATKGIITFKNLMEALSSEFQVEYAIDKNGDFRIEHKSYWENNGSYFSLNSVGIDLVTIYPSGLEGTNEYTFESNLPIREKFSFGEAWNLDFTGIPISYENCIKVGDEISYNADQITTDMDPQFMFSTASKEGFCMFHCSSIPESDGTFMILPEVGKLSDSESKNAHLSWANLQDAYWKYGRYLPSGMMNGKYTDFTPRPLKYQRAIAFPYCFSEFNANKLIRTYLGDGGVKTASFNFKTNFFTVELEYKDNL